VGTNKTTKEKKMGITVNTNVGSLVAQSYLSGNQSKLSKTLSRLSSGLRVTEAKDDPAGLAIAQSMASSVRVLKQGSRNGNDGVSLLQTAQGAMSQTLEILQRMREIASQASSGTYGSGDLANLDTEFQALKDEIDRVQVTSTFNGIDLLNGGSVSIQIGENNTANDRISLSLTTTDTTTLTINGDDVTSQANGQTALDTLKAAIDTVTTGLATLGAAQSNLEAAVNSNDTRAVNLDTARSRIMDADYAEESANLAKYMIMNQSNVAMLSQANSSPQLVLKLLG
jgi:flagellin